MILTTLSFGENIENHYQATFAILTYLNDRAIDKICVITDKPKFYEFLKSKIEIIEINQNNFSDWLGESNFFWRIKMKAIESIALKYPDSDIIYVDSDTFHIKNLSEIKKRLDQGLVYMHENEGQLHQMPSKTTRKMWSVLSGKSFVGLEINKKTEMWNAGVIAIGKEQALQLIDKSIKICDEICNTNSPQRLVEQFAFSVALNSTGKLTSANKNIGHYWGNKPEWNANILNLMVEIALTNLSVDDAIILAQKIVLKNIPIIKKERRIKDTLMRFIQSTIQPKQVKYAHIANNAQLISSKNLSNISSTQKINSEI